MVMAQRVTNAIMVTLNDCGLGVAPEKHTATLQQFRQLKSSVIAKLERTRLGVSLAACLLGLLGKQTAEGSELDGGAPFIFSLPDSTLILPVPFTLLVIQ